MTQPVEVAERDWSEVVGGDELTLVDFWAPWCGWCRRLAPVFAGLASEYTGRVKFVKVNVDEQLGLARQYGVQSLPTLTFLCGGRPVGEIVGFLPEKGLRRAIDDALAAHLSCAAA